LEAAGHLGWTKRYHTRFSWKSERGFPDLVLVRPPRLIIAELKRDDRDTTAEQEDWLSTLRLVPGIEVYVWRPRDYDEVIRILR
jgi:hypothetical protein